MRTQHKWWFLSEANEEQPGTDKDIDYYLIKSKAHEETSQPLCGGRVKCNQRGQSSPFS